jgi:hypothetical protein
MSRNITFNKYVFILPIDNVRPFWYQVVSGKCLSLYRAEIHKTFDQKTRQRSQLQYLTQDEREE